MTRQPVREHPSHHIRGLRARLKPVCKAAPGAINPYSDAVPRPTAGTHTATRYGPCRVCAAIAVRTRILVRLTSPERPVSSISVPPMASMPDIPRSSRQAARAHDGLARALRASRAMAGAGGHLRDAIAIYADLGVPRAGQLRELFSDVPAGTRSPRY